MKNIIILIASLALISNTEHQQDDPIIGAFGIILGSNADELEEKGFLKYLNEPGLSIRFVRFDEDDLLSEKTVWATPITRTITSIEGSKYYPGSSFRSCTRDYRLIVNEIERRYPSLKKASGASGIEDDYWTVQYASRLESEGIFAGLYPDSRSISVTCASQTVGGTSLIVRYSAAPRELAEASSESDLDREQRTTGRLRERGLDPDDL